MNFKELHLHPILLENLQKNKFLEPTPIQQKVIPLILDRNDVIASAQTGTGKTAAFLLPILQHIRVMLENQTISKNEMKCIILAPTRELAMQIDEQIELFSKGLNVKHFVVTGGIDIQFQIDTIKKYRPQILTATPGRLIDLMHQKVLIIKYLKFLVLDEADRMLDMGFLKDIQLIAKKIPSQRQTYLFSATIQDHVKALSNELLKAPKFVQVEKSLVNSTQIEQSFYSVKENDKLPFLLKILKDFQPKQTLVFFNTKRKVDELGALLQRGQFSITILHSDQSQFLRTQALEHFKEGRVKILLATDIASRGLDVADMDLVVNFDTPKNKETYVHRIGRTGRAGANGKSITFSNNNELPVIQKIISQLQLNIPIESVNSTELGGAGKKFKNSKSSKPSTKKYTSNNKKKRSKK